MGDLDVPIGAGGLEVVAGAALHDDVGNGFDLLALHRNPVADDLGLGELDLRAVLQ